MENTHSEEGRIDDASVCPLNGRFIKWDPSKSCINLDQMKESWTGVMRSREMLTSTNDGKLKDWNTFYLISSIMKRPF